MRTNNFNNYRFQFGPGMITPGVKFLIWTNVGVFILQMLLGDSLILWFGLHAKLFFHRFYIWQIVTYMFLHAGFLHLFFNMLMLWLFGVEVERNLGLKEFLIYYLSCGLGAGVFHLALSSSSVIGASGAVYGVIIAFVMIFPDRLLFFFPFPIALKAKYWAVIFVGISLIFGTFGNDRVAHFAHLGGMAVGFIYFKIKGSWKIRHFIYMKKAEREAKRQVKEEIERQKLRLEVDAILDKISERGYESLTDKEIKILKQASKLFARSEDEI